MIHGNLVYNDLPWCSIPKGCLEMGGETLVGDRLGRAGRIRLPMVRPVRGGGNTDSQIDRFTETGQEFLWWQTTVRKGLDSGLILATTTHQIICTSNGDVSWHLFLPTRATL